MYSKLVSIPDALMWRYFELLSFRSMDEISEFKAQVEAGANPRDIKIKLAEGRLVNLGNATGHPSRIMDGSFANQVLAQIFLFAQKYADLPAELQAERLTVEVLPKKLDEEVALEMVRGFGGVVTQLTQQQADYIGVTVEGPFKPETYRY